MRVKLSINEKRDYLLCDFSIKSRGKKIWLIRKMPLNLSPHCPMV